MSNPFEMPDQEFCQIYRVRKEMVLCICDELEVVRRPQNGDVLPVLIKLLTSLHLLADGNYQDGTGQQHGLSITQYTVSIYFSQFTEAVNRRCYFNKESFAVVSDWLQDMFVKLCGLLLLGVALAIPDPNYAVNYGGSIQDAIYDTPGNYMPQQKAPHMKASVHDYQSDVQTGDDFLRMGPWAPFDIPAAADGMAEDAPEHNRLKRRAKRRRGRGQRRRGGSGNTVSPQKDESKNGSATSEVPVARRSSLRRKKKDKNRPTYDTYEPPVRQGRLEDGPFVELPKDLYQAHLRPGVIFRIHMSEAILKMQYRNYGEDKDESVIEADVEYLRLTRKVINDEITKFEDLRWLVGWFSNRSQLIQEHTCNTKYYAVGTPPTIWTHPEEYMKRMCLFDNVYLDHIPYVIGEDSSLMAAVAPPVLHCDASTCTSVPFIDSLMFDEKLDRTNVRTVTRCQASCRAHCRNDPDCLKRCSDRCLRTE